MVVLRSFVIAGKPGKYISIENGLMVESAPRIRITTKCCLRVIIIIGRARYNATYSAKGFSLINGSEVFSQPVSDRYKKTARTFTCRLLVMMGIIFPNSWC
jgi:hypothetical protein